MGFNWIKAFDKYIKQKVCRCFVSHNQKWFLAEYIRLKIQEMTTFNSNPIVLSRIINVSMK